MKPLHETLVYALAAALAVGTAYWVHSATGEPEVAGFEDVGGFLYPDPDDQSEPAFADPGIARSLKLATYDDESEKQDTFEVTHVDGVWRLSDFDGYPADAATRVANTLTSVTHVKKEGRQTRRSAQHGELGVLDPLDKATYGEQGHGDRITIRGESDKVLVDLIVGDRVPDSSVPNLRYVRRADEDTVYRAVVEIDVSTRFRDWINDDLLALDPKKDVSLELEEFDDPNLEETEEQKAAREREERDRDERIKAAEIVALRSAPPVFGTVGPTALDVIDVHRENPTADWELQSLDPETETLVAAPIEAVVRALGRLKIVDVLPKPEGLGADLTLELPADLARDPRAVDVFRARIGQSLVSRGFGIELEGDAPVFVGVNGSLEAAATSGVVYRLHFGRESKGTERRLELGRSSDEDTDNEFAGRYLVVSVDFDERYVPGRPTKPEPPVRPPELVDPQPNDPTTPAEEAPDEAGDGDEPGAEDASGTDSASDDREGEPDGEQEAEGDADAAADPSTEEPPVEGEPEPASPEEPNLEELQLRFDAEKAFYERRLQAYENDLAKWVSRVEAGRQRAAVLHHRFAQWYYVIAESDFDDLVIQRSDIVEPKEPPASPPEKEPTPGSEPAIEPVETPEPGDSPEDPSPAEDPSAEPTPARESDSAAPVPPDDPGE